jgi:signal peptidase I
VTGKAVYIWMHKQPGWNLPTFARNGVIDRPEPPQGEQQ